MPDYLYLDTETLPTQDQRVIDRIAAGIKPPSNYTKPETIAKWEADTKPDAVRDAVAKTSFDGGRGHICCISWAVNGAVPDAFIIEDISQEREMLVRTFAAIEEQRTETGIPIVVGHHIAFDLMMLMQRCIVLGVKYPVWLPKDPKPWGADVNDTMLMWAGAKGMISMDELCSILGIEGKGDISGADVADIWKRGNFEAIANYCAGDIDRTRKMHLKIVGATSFLPRWADPNADNSNDLDDSIEGLLAS